MPGAEAAFLLLEEERGQYKIGASWPDESRDLGYLTPAAEAALTQRRGLIHEVGPNGRTQTSLSQRVEHVAYPIDVNGHLHGVVVVDLGFRSASDRQAVLRQLHWGIGWLETLFRRRQAEADRNVIEKAAFVLDVMAVAGEHQRLQATALALVNHLATRLSCRRVSLGLVRRHSIRLVAISHTANFQAKSDVVAAIENAMEEALGQAANVTLPMLPRRERTIILAHEVLARRSGAAALASIELISAERTVGIVTLERDTGAVFDQLTLDMLKTAGELLGPVLDMKREANRFLAGRLADQVRRALAAVFGPRRPGAKLIAAFVAVTVLALTMAQGQFRVSAKSVVEASREQAIVAAFDGYVASASVRAGDVVEAGQVLATLDDRDLRLDAVKARSALEEQTLKYAEALGRQDRVLARVTQAAVEEARAQLAIVEDKIGQSRLTSTFRGVVIAGDLSQTIGLPVEKGKVLFEVAPVDAFRISLQVDERDISLITPGERGVLVLTSLTNRSLPFSVRTVTPVATTSDGHNTFRVEGDLQDHNDELRPGMEGIGKVEIDRRPLLAIWFRPLIAWLRMTTWTWLP